MNVLALVENALLEWATDPRNEVPGLVFEAIDKLSLAITRTVITNPEVVTEGTAASSRMESDHGGIELSGHPSLSATSSHETTSSEAAPIQRSGRELNLLLFGEVTEALDRVLTAAGIDRLTLLLDEWTAVPFELQPLLAEFLKRSVFGNPRITTKIASIEYRSNFSEALDHNNVLGFELGADISSHIELDDYFVYDRNPE